MGSNSFIFRNSNDGRASNRNKYRYIKRETEVFSSDTVCNCSYVYKCKCSKDNPVNRLSDEGFGRVQDELNPVQQEDYDAVYGRQDTVDSSFDSNDDIEEKKQ